MNYCQKGRELLLDLKRADFLPANDDEGVRLLISEMNEIIAKMTDITNSTDMSNDNVYAESVKPTISYYLECLERNNRYINSYLTFRISKIRTLPWETGTVLPERMKHDTLSSRENDYFNAYSSCLSDYSNAIGFDLISDMEPPKELLIQIRVIVPCGEIMTDYGPVNLSLKGSEQFVRRTDVEHLIRHGKVEHVQWDGGKL